MLEEVLPQAYKRAKIDVAAEDESAATTEGQVQRHPLGVRPSGNAFTAPLNAKASVGQFAALPDELLAQLLEYLEAGDILRLGGTCRAWHAFTRNEELWRALFVESQPASHFLWQGTWRSTYLAQSITNEPSVDCSNLFSDTLHRPFFCAHVPLRHFTQSIPKDNDIHRLKDLSEDEFQAKWVDEPFILTQPVKQWKAFRDWSMDRLVTTYEDVAFRAESVDWPLATYIEYLKTSQDESPLYLFDRAFVEKMGLKVSNEPGADADYWPPTCFGFDAFKVLDEQRPDHRWLIIGPARSGSTFHKDPNATSAWNAVIRGSKYWIMFRSSPTIPPPPGVYVSADQSEVTSPLSIAEWLLGYHAEARRTPGCREGICHEGEVLYVPSGWYHLVLNLETSIALTQNFVPPARVGAVMQFLRDQKQSISGFAANIDDPYQLFVERLQSREPALLERGLHDLERLTSGTKSKWQAATETKEAETAGNGFSFGFGGGDDDDEVP